MRKPSIHVEVPRDVDATKERAKGELIDNCQSKGGATKTHRHLAPLKISNHIS